MTIRIRTLFVSGLLVAAMWLTGCDHYVCGNGATFGNTTCTASGSGLGTGTGTSTASAYVYAVDEGTSSSTNTGTIDGYAYSSSGVTFGPISSYTAPTIPLNGGGTGMVVAQDLYLYVALAENSSIYGWTIGSSGSLTAISGSPFTSIAPAGFIGGVGQNNMIVNPAGTFLFISDAVNAAIIAYSIGSGGVLTEVGAYACPAGFTPMNLTTDGLGKYLYAVSGTNSTHTGSAIAAFSIGSTGALTAVSGSPFPFPMWQVIGEPTGNFLIGTSGRTYDIDGVDDDNLYVFSITQTGTSPAPGAIQLTTTQPTTYAPFSIAVSPNSGGNLVYSFGFNDTASGFNPIEGFTISSTGTLAEATGEPFGFGEGSWAQFDQSGTLLFSYSSVLNESTDETVTQISPLSVGSGGTLTEPVSATTLTTPGFWAVADAP
jgi:hypothetical protein